jgi:phosphatidylglycerol---prolipoprotein diacylglyceryl transferase
MYPRLIEIGPLTIYAYGVMIVLGFAAGVLLATRLARLRGLPASAFVDAAALILFSAIIGARIVFVGLNWDAYAHDPIQMFALWEGGLSFHGGAIGGVLATVWFLRRRQIRMLPMLDAAAPGLSLGYAIGRIGCLLNGCCYGAPTELAIGVRFIGADPTLHYHPAQAYASLTHLLLITPALVWAYHRPHRSGQIFALFVAGYSIYRFAIEFLRRGVSAEVLAFNLTVAQVFSLAALAAAVAWWFWLRRHSTPAPEASPAGTDGAPSEPVKSRV